MSKNEIVESVEGRVNELAELGGIDMPSGYSPGNALRAASLILKGTKDKNGRNALESCTNESIANTLLDMIVQGLNPAKKQCYFIPYGQTLTMVRSYFGSLTLARRSAGVTNVSAQVIYESDTFESEIVDGDRVIRKHVQPLESFGGKIIGAYAVVKYRGGLRDAVLMSMQQIRSSWEQGRAKGGSPAHKKFPEEMAKKTVINRALKMAINGSGDFPDNDPLPPEQAVAEDLSAVVEDQGQTQSISFDSETGEIREPEEQPEPDAPGKLKKAVEASNDSPADNPGF